MGDGPGQIIFGGKLATGDCGPDEINDLQKRRKAITSQVLDEVLSQKIMSVSTTVGGPELIPEDGLKIKVGSGRTYYGAFPIDAVRVADGEKLERLDVKLGPSSPLPFMKVAAESKSIIYILYRSSCKAIAVTPVSIKQLWEFPTVLDSMARHSYKETSDSSYR